MQEIDGSYRPTPPPPPGPLSPPLHFESVHLLTDIKHYGQPTPPGHTTPQLQSPPPIDVKPLATRTCSLPSTCIPVHLSAEPRCGPTDILMQALKAVQKGCYYRNVFTVHAAGAYRISSQSLPHSMASVNICHGKSVRYCGKCIHSTRTFKIKGRVFDYFTVYWDWK